MLKRLVWKEEDLLVLQLHKEVYTVCQLLRNNYILSFDYFASSPDIKGVNFNKEKILFCCPSIPYTLSFFAHSKVTKNNSINKDFEPSRLWVSQNNFYNKPHLPKYDNRNPIAYLLKSPPYSVVLSQCEEIELITEDNLNIIYEYEMTNLRTDLAFRLYSIFLTGQNKDLGKEAILGLNNMSWDKYKKEMISYYYDVSPYIETVKDFLMKYEQELKES